MIESTFDDILYGKLKMHQPLHGPRISVDTILLSWFAKLKNDDNVIELGTASGAVALILAKRWPHVPVIRAIDIQEDLIKMAKENAAINGLSDRVVFEVGDIRKIHALYPTQSFDVVVVNPPYNDISGSRISPKRNLAISRQGIACTLEDVIKASFYLLKDKGRLYLILRAKRISELCYFLEKNRMPLKRLKVVYPKPGREASVVLVEARRNTGRGACIEPPVYICDESGNYTPELLSAYKIGE